MKSKFLLLTTVLVGAISFVVTDSASAAVKEENKQNQSNLKKDMTEKSLKTFTNNNIVFSKKDVVSLKSDATIFEKAKHYLKNTQDDTVSSFTIENKEDMKNALTIVYETYPKKVEFNSKKLKHNDLKDLYREVKETFSNPNETPLYHSFLSYKESKSGTKFILTDNTSNEYSAQTIKPVFDRFTSTLAEELKGETKEQSIVNLSSFIYENYKYNARGTQFMTVANFMNKEMACQGFSFFAQETLRKMGIDSKIRLGESHYWLVAEIDGKEITFDVTTDIVLKQKFATLGLSTQEHINKTASVGFYSAKYETNKYHEVNSYLFGHTDVTKTIK